MLAVASCPCGSGAKNLVRAYDAPPPLEMRSLAENYRRELWHCPVCGHYVNRHNIDMNAYYAGQYVDATYGTHMQHVFESILALPPAQSDNAQRVIRVLALCQQHFAKDVSPTVLDVGSGLCVFLHGLRQKVDWQCLAIDPDARAVEHARTVAGIPALQSDFIIADVETALMTAGFATRYSLISFNKVLEHVVHPVAMLEKARTLLTKDGIIYVELPDGECASEESLDCEEFHLEHWHVFSMTSACLLAQKAGFTVLCTGRVREPSGKRTLWLWGTPCACVTKTENT